MVAIWLRNMFGGTAIAGTCALGTPAGELPADVAAPLSVVERLPLGGATFGTAGSAGLASSAGGCCAAIDGSRDGAEDGSAP